MKKKPVKKVISRVNKRQRISPKIITFFLIAFSLVVTIALINTLSSRKSADSQSSAYAAGNRWESGASCHGVSSGAFAAWRGSPVTIAGTWNDASLAVQKEQWSMSASGEYKNWTESIDNAVGAFWGSNWQAAARGDHDANIRTALQNIYKGWGNKKTVYLRYAHEFNGNWYQWKVTPADNEYFKQASIRFYNLVQQELVSKGKDARVAWAPNNGEHNGVNTELSWPGDQYIDVVAIDYYDWSVLNTQAKWDADFMKRSKSGGPEGIGAWQDFARRHGKPLAFSEWGTSGGSPTDNPFFIQKMNEFMTANAGTGPGQVIYDVYFNCTGYGGSGGEKFQIYPNTVLPQTAAKYKSLKWGTTIIESATPTPTIVAVPTSTPTMPPSQPTPTTTPIPTNTPVPTATPTVPQSQPTPTSTPTAGQISLRSSITSLNGSGSKTLTISKPSLVVAGDVLVAHIAVHTSSTTITAPSGWKLIRSTQSSDNLKMTTYYKVATLSEPVSYTWTFNVSKPATGGITAFSGVNTSNPVQTSSGRYNGSTATVTFNQVTTVYPNSMVLAFVAVSANTTVTQPSGLIERYDRNNISSTNGKTIELSTQLKATTGLTTVGSGKEDSATKSNLTQIVILRPQ